ncbi:hypothetical protein [Mucilaginibacter lappiensis]|uniref:hypothetical protein n=1 Tax=Mucilaginibacter lappiensis TaxID=354630 RepID=UPI003D1CE92F
MKVIIWSFVIVFFCFVTFSIHYNGSSVTQMGYPQIFYQSAVFKGEYGQAATHGLLVYSLLFDLFVAIVIALLCGLINKLRLR